MRLLTLLVCAGLGAASVPAQQVRRPSPETVRAWQARKFGMFIHWGLYSIPAGVWNGQRIATGYSEQIMRHAPIPRDDYAALARQFNPTRWNPDAVAKLARAAGMKFIVITSKHHDGFNMFHTAQSKYNVVDATPYGKDVVKGLAEACARNGLKFGVYYSTLDWYDPRATPWDMPNVKENDNPVPKSHEDFNVAQLKELTANYGPLSEIWFDMGRPTPAQSKRFTDTVHAAQPECMVSGRVFNHQGDFTVMGDNALPDYIIDEPWQTPASMYDETWGYRSWQQRTDLPGKTNEHILKLVKVVSHGGNYLLNIGPRGDGSVVEFEADVLRGIGKWLDANGEAIYDTRPQPFRKLDFGYATVKGSRLYLLVGTRPAGGRLRLPGLETKIAKAWFLTDAAQTALPVDNTALTKTVTLTQATATPPVTVVVAELAGPLSVIPPTIQPDARGVITLRLKDADKFYNYNGLGYYAPRTLYKERWNFQIAREGNYRIEVKTKAGAALRKLQYDVDGRKLLAGTPAAAEIRLRPKPYLQFTITPPEPFEKGADIGAPVEEIVLTPVE